MNRAARAACALGLAGTLPALAAAQAGPPFLSNDPGTPGNGRWEINIAAAQSVASTSAAYQVPQLDVNYGIGDRIQLTYEVPYVIATADGQPAHAGFGNAYPGLKWRFIDQGEDGWQVSAFPQLQTRVARAAELRGIGEPGPRLLLPLEAAVRVGAVDLDMEAGCYVPERGAHEEIAGLVAGHRFAGGLDLAAELYRDQPSGAQALGTTTLDVGGRYELGRHLLALFMAGRGIGGQESPRFIGYFGMQILLGPYGGGSGQ